MAVQIPPLTLPYPGGNPWNLFLTNNVSRFQLNPTECTFPDPKLLRMTFVKLILGVQTLKLFSISDQHTNETNLVPP